MLDACLACRFSCRSCVSSQAAQDQTASQDNIAPPNQAFRWKLDAARRHNTDQTRRNYTRVTRWTRGSVGLPAGGQTKYRATGPRPLKGRSLHARSPAPPPTLGRPRSVAKQNQRLACTGERDAGAMTTEDQRRRQVDAGVHWAEAAGIQIQRVRTVNVELAQLKDLRPWEKPGWEADYMKPWYRLEADRNLLLVAGYHLVRAVEFLHPPPTQDTSALDGIRALGSMLKTLRDCVEHWDEKEITWMPRPPTPKSGQAYQELLQISPDGDMQSYQWSASGHDAVIAGILDLRTLDEAVRAAREYFRKLADGDYVWDGWP